MVERIRSSERTPLVLHQRPESGFVLISTLFTLVLLMTAVALVFVAAVTEQRQQRRARAQLDARATNDSVLARTLAELAVDHRFPGVAKGVMDESDSYSTVVDLGQGRSAIVVESSGGTQSLRTETIVSSSSNGATIVLGWRSLPTPSSDGATLQRE